MLHGRTRTVLGTRMKMVTQLKLGTNFMGTVHDRCVFFMNELPFGTALSLPEGIAEICMTNPTLLGSLVPFLQHAQSRLCTVIVATYLSFDIENICAKVCRDNHF